MNKIRIISLGTIIALSCGCLQAAEAAVIIKKVETKEPCVALTFDDGPLKEIAPKMLDLFKKHEIKCTFFVVGNQLKARPELAKRIIAEGHEIGNHTMTHSKRLTKMTPEKAQQEIVDLQQSVKTITAVEPVIFRPPWGSINDELLAFLGKQGISYSVSHSVAAYDWLKETTSEEIVEHVSKAGAGDIVLMHEREATLAALPEIIKNLKAKGLKLVTVSELMKLEGVLN